MTTYISFESALHILTVAYTVPVLLLIVALLLAVLKLLKKRVSFNTARYVKLHH